MKTNMNYVKNQNYKLRESFKLGWYSAQASLELIKKNSCLALGVLMESPEGSKWEDG